MVALPNKPLREYGLNSTQAKLFAINQNQAELFFRLYQENLDIPQLPKVSKFLLGEVTTPLRRNLLQTTDGEELQQFTVFGSCCYEEVHSFNSSCHDALYETFCWEKGQFDERSLSSQ